MQADKKPTNPDALTLQSLPLDILLLVFDFLRDREMLRVMATCWRFHNCRNRFFYRTHVDAFRIINLPYYDRFVNVVMDMASLIKFFPPPKPGQTTILHKKLPMNTRHLILKDISYGTAVRQILKTPATLVAGLDHLTHLTLDRVRVEIDLVALKTLTHLTWILGNFCEHYRNRPVHLPPNLVALKIVTGQILDIRYPVTLRYLAIDYGSQENAITFAPSVSPVELAMISVTGNVRFADNAIPASVKKMVFGKGCSLAEIYIPPTVDECVVHSRQDAVLIAERFPHLARVTCVDKREEAGIRKKKKPHRRH